MLKRHAVITLIALFSIAAACGPQAPTPDPIAAQVTVALAVQGTLTALAPTVTPTLTATETPTATDTPRPSDTPRPTFTPQPTAVPPTLGPLETYYLLIDDYIHIAEPYVKNGTYPPCRLLEAYAVDPSKAYYRPGYEPGGPVQRMYEMGGAAYDPEQHQIRVVPVQCR